VIKNHKLSVIGFDADDTLWVNETFFREAEEEFASLMDAYETPNRIHQELYKIEVKNLPIYGYGIKGFVLSMIETAIDLSDGKVSQKNIQDIVNIGKSMLNKPVELLPGVKECLSTLSEKYRIILATKGDLLDQERKLEKSGLSKYFHHIEVMSDKKAVDYKKLLQHLDIEAEEFLMIGNSLKSDVLPVIELGAHAIHIPFHTTWEHEKVCESTLEKYSYQTLKSLLDIQTQIA